MIDRVRRELSDEDIAKIANTYHRWRDKPEALKKKGLEPYADELGFCKGGYARCGARARLRADAGAVCRRGAEEDDGVPFEEKICGT